MNRTSILLSCAAVALLLSGCAAGTTSSSSTSPGSNPAPVPPSGKTLSIPGDCPTSAVVSSALGVTVPDPQVTKEDDSLTCLYLSTESKNGAIVMYQKAPAGTDVNTLKAAAAAKTNDQQATQVNGLGDIAFEVKGDSGYAVVVLSGGIELYVAGGTSATAVENFARTLLH